LLQGVLQKAIATGAIAAAVFAAMAWIPVPQSRPAEVQRLPSGAQPPEQTPLDTPLRHDPIRWDVFGNTPKLNEPARGTPPAPVADPGMPQTERDRLILVGLILNPSGSRAILREGDGPAVSVGVGGTVAGCTVEEIDVKAVLLSCLSGRKRLTFPTRDARARSVQSEPIATAAPQPQEEPPEGTPPIAP
jgi:hypothetical protein